MIGYHLRSSVPVPDPYMPLVTMICPTFGRAAKQPELLNEALYWMVNQDYPNVEVLILNDAPGQTLVCNHPRVRIVNWPERLPNLGEKMNLGVMLAAGSICMCAEDDDISLPWRCSQAVKCIAGYDYFHPGYWFYVEKATKDFLRPDGNGMGHNCAAYRRDTMLGRYSSIILGHDRDATAYAQKNLRISPQTLIGKPERISYLYRWGWSEMHLSGCPDPEMAWKTYFPGVAGRYQIEPVMKEDWASLARNTAALLVPTH